MCFRVVVHILSELISWSRSSNTPWCFPTSCVRVLSPDSVSSLIGVERWDTDPSSSRSSSESSSDVLLMASSLGGGGALAAVFLWSSVSSLLLLLLPKPSNSHRDAHTHTYMHQQIDRQIYAYNHASNLLWDCFTKQVEASCSPRALP